MSQELSPAPEAPLDGSIGEGWGGDGVTGVHVNLVIGVTGSATAAAAAVALASPAPGHVPFLACAGGGTVIRPATVIVNKTTLDHLNLERCTWGAAQLGVAQAVLDAVADGVLPADGADRLVLLVVAWLDPGLGAVTLTPELETAVRVSARAATGAAIADASRPSSAESLRALVARRDTITNGFYGGR